MSEEVDKNKIKVTSLITDRDRLIYAQEREIPKVSASPKPRDLKKEVLDDILKRIEQRNAEIKKRSAQQA